MSVPAALKERVPLVTAAGVARFKRLTEHPDAPRFNHATGDRLVRADLPALRRFRDALASLRAERKPGPPAPEVLERVRAYSGRVPLLRARLLKGLDLRRHWDEVPTSSRRDLAEAPWSFVPDGEDLERLVIYRTAGTTGHPISVPHHPLAVAAYLPLIELALERHGVKLEPTGLEAACFLLGSQVHTYSYATVLSGWGGAGFVKLNLRGTEWPEPGSAARYFAAFRPPLITGDPVSVLEAVRLGLPLAPKAVVTTSTTLTPAARARIARATGAVVIDWYSLVETGPIGYACPRGNGFHQLPHDIHLEVVDRLGRPAPEGERGEVVVTGGRNPYAPLLRYRTGDSACLEYGRCVCGDPMPRVMGLEGREPVLFRSSDGTPVTTVDLSRLLREFPLLQHRFVQRADLSCELTVRTLPGERLDRRKLDAALRAFLGARPLDIREDPALGEDGKKVVCYESALGLTP
ncbi:MAG: phenylacetate--CoA ligase family protein [Elusimicrobia bacterium]|nr:phenylacetate--CoA ligase family protein [Elusimicrobiota bacterium]